MVLPDFDYLAPKTLDEASNLLHELGEHAMVIAGGCDTFPPMKQGAFADCKYLIDLKHIPGLDKIEYDEKEGLKIGCLVKLFDIQTSALVKEKNPAVAQAAKYIASTQVRNKGTLMGNICAAVPSCDGGPILIAQNAKILVKGHDENRSVPAENFFTGVKKTCLAYDEIATHIVVPPLGEDECAAYIKFATRKAMDLAIVGVAAWLKMDGETVADARIALGAVATTPILAPAAGEFLIGKKLDDAVLEECGVIAMNSCRPISDVRASAEYRRDMVRVFTKRAIRKAIEGYGGDQI